MFACGLCNQTKTSTSTLISFSSMDELLRHKEALHQDAIITTIKNANNNTTHQIMVNNWEISLLVVSLILFKIFEIYYKCRFVHRNYNDVNVRLQVYEICAFQTFCWTSLPNIGDNFFIEICSVLQQFFLKIH